MHDLSRHAEHQLAKEWLRRQLEWEALLATLRVARAGDDGPRVEDAAA